jgi:predicted nicotinamide N-methyase
MLSAQRWLPPGHQTVTRRHRLGRLDVALYQVADPSRLSDELDEESFAEDERFPYWAELWPSAVALARFVARQKWPADIPTLELGCGTGLAGVAAAKMGADVLFTDYEAEPLAFARANHALNLGRPGRTQLFDWRTPPRRLQTARVLAADVLYEHRFLDPFLSTLCRVLAQGGTAFVAEPGRKIADGSVERLEREGFLRDLHLEEVVLGDITHSIWIHEITRPNRRAATTPWPGKV